MAKTFNPIMHKFHAVRTECDGIKFASKREAREYQNLKLMQASGKVVFFYARSPSIFQAASNTSRTLSYSGQTETLQSRMPRGSKLSSTSQKRRWLKIYILLK